MADEKQTKNLEPRRPFLAQVYQLVVAAGVILALLFGVNAYVDSRIDDAVNDIKFIRKVASNVRPYMIFDESATITVDAGAMQYLEEAPKIEMDDHNLPDKIIVTPAEHLARAPLIEVLNKYHMTFKAERGRGHQWIYTTWVHGTLTSKEVELPPARFRLEILR
jgi:hypothetical protein